MRLYRKPVHQLQWSLPPRSLYKRLSKDGIAVISDTDVMKLDSDDLITLIMFLAKLSDDNIALQSLYNIMSSDKELIPRGYIDYLKMD